MRVILTAAYGYAGQLANICNVMLLLFQWFCTDINHCHCEWGEDWWAQSSGLGTLTTQSCIPCQHTGLCGNWGYMLFY